jgi:hypothetical protein
VVYQYIVDNRALSSEHFLACEISESLGVMYYSKVIDSQMYRYPMHVMTDHWKHQMAKTARSCFQFAVDALGVTMSDEGLGSQIDVGSGVHERKSHLLLSLW